MKTVNREKLIATLSSVIAGLARRENVEQSTCFVFRKGKVYTFNEEVMCSAECKVGFDGAVTAAPFLTLLDRMSEETVDLEAEDNNLRIVGKNREATLLFDTKISLPISQVEEPKSWSKLPSKFVDAIKLVKGCCSANDLKFELTCVHITKRFIEASDNVQCARFDLKMKVKKDFLIRADAADFLVNADLTEFSESKQWVHFRSPSGRVLSCRRYMDKYPDYSPVFEKLEGLTKFKIPSGLAQAVDKARIFTSAMDSATSGRELLSISMKPGKLTLKGSGTIGSYRETQKIKYSGEELSFAVSPATFREIVSHHSKAYLNKQKLSVVGNDWRMVFCLFDSTEK